MQRCVLKLCSVNYHYWYWHENNACIFLYILQSIHHLKVNILRLKQGIPHLRLDIPHLRLGIPHLRLGIPHLRLGIHQGIPLTNKQLIHQQSQYYLHILDQVGTTNHHPQNSNLKWDNISRPTTANSLSVWPDRPVWPICIPYEFMDSSCPYWSGFGTKQSVHYLGIS